MTMFFINCFYTLIIVYVHSNENCICSKTIHTPPLLDQFNKPINWNKYNIIAIGNKKKHKIDENLLNYFLTKFKLLSSDICIIAAIPSWFSNFGSQILLKKSIRFIELNDPVYIDWHHRFANANNITKFPTIIIKTKQNSLELGRISGILTKQKLECFFKNQNLQIT